MAKVEFGRSTRTIGLFHFMEYINNLDFTLIDKFLEAKDANSAAKCEEIRKKLEAEGYRDEVVSYLGRIGVEREEVSELLDIIYRAQKVKSDDPEWTKIMMRLFPYLAGWIKMHPKAFLQEMWFTSEFLEAALATKGELFAYQDLEELKQAPNCRKDTFTSQI